MLVWKVEERSRIVSIARLLLLQHNLYNIHRSHRLTIVTRSCASLPTQKVEISRTEEPFTYNIAPPADTYSSDIYNKVQIHTLEPSLCPPGSLSLSRSRVLSPLYHKAFRKEAASNTDLASGGRAVGRQNILITSLDFHTVRRLNSSLNHHTYFSSSTSSCFGARSFAVAAHHRKHRPSHILQSPRFPIPSPCGAVVEVVQP